MVRDSLSRFENHIQNLIEGGFARIFGGRLHPHDVALQLFRAMEDHLEVADNTVLYVPDLYRVEIGMDDYAAILKSEPDFDQRLAREIVAMARDLGYVLSHFPRVQLKEDPSLDLGECRVTASHSAAQLGTTQSLSVPSGPINASLVAQPRAALIMDEDRRIEIDRPVLNIGRQRSNHIILDNPDVSRQHAQIRLRHGRHILIDLNSSAGTRLNGLPIQESVLQSGDVIGLGAINLAYVVESPQLPPGSDLPALPASIDS